MGKMEQVVVEVVGLRHIQVVEVELADSHKELEGEVGVEVMEVEMEV
jgi:hypothetical protein